MSLLNPRWKYTPAASTNVADTLKKFGFKATTDAERKARQLRDHADEKQTDAKVTPISKRKSA